MGTPREFALHLMDRVLCGELSVEEFCSLYEHHFNFDWPNRGTEAQLELFDKLFNTVAWFSAFPQELATVPNYTGEQEVMSLVRLVRSQVVA